MIYYKEHDLTIGPTALHKPLVLIGCRGIKIDGVQVRQNTHIEHEGFLDIWHMPDGRPPAAGIVLIDCAAIEVAHCDVRYNQIGVAAYKSTQLNIHDNDASHNSAWGFLLHDVTYSAYHHNAADFCCRVGDDHLGGDAAGFLLVHGSSYNWFRDNKARMGGDGFFLAGYHHQSGLLSPCQHNEFSRNDMSWSPNNGFESTFCIGNKLIDNRIEGCRYGIWLGYDTGSRVDGNALLRCQVGLAIENSRNGQVHGNQFKGNRHGWVVWSRGYPWTDKFPHHQTSSHWVFADNQYAHNVTPAAVRANYAHAMYPIVNGEAPAPYGIMCEDDISVQGDGDDD